MSQGTQRVAVLGTRFRSLDIEERILAPLGVELTAAPAASPQELLAAARDAAAILAGSAPKLNADVIGQLEQCRVITRYGIGVDTVDLEAARARGIIVTNVPDYCIDEVSTQAVTLLLAGARKIVAGHALVSRGEWGLASLRPMHSLATQTLGLLGYGRIGRATGQKARAFGLSLLVYDPYLPEGAELDGARRVDLDALLAESDYISLHMPLTPETHHILGEEAISRMKAGAYVINTSRGGLVDEAALMRALEAGHLSGAGLDVFEQEPPRPDDPILRAPNVTLSPHSAWYSERSEVEMREKAAADVARVLRGERPAYPVVLPEQDAAK